MENPEIKENNGTNGEETPKEEPKQTTEVTVVKQKGGLMTALKIGGGLVLLAAGTGLGWLLKGLFGKSDDDDEEDQAESVGPTED